jgi:putative DNA primase/helicase
LLKCHAGCPNESIVAALGLTMADLFAAQPSGPKRRIVATYDYVDALRRLLFQTVRFEPKGFSQRRPDRTADGGWAWNLKGVARVLYRLPDVLLAEERRETIFVCEGEKDCDAMAKAGFVGTCNPMGAGKWLAEHTETLKRATKVVVIADKVEPGRKHAQAVATALRSCIGSVKIVELPDRNGHAVKDAADFLGAGGTATELRSLVEATPEFGVKPSAPQPARFKAGGVASEYLGVDEPSHDNDDGVFTSLAKLRPTEYDRAREKEAKRLGIRVATLDAEVAQRRPASSTSGQGRTVELPDLEPWPESVNGAQVLNEVAATFARYVALPPGAADALTLWAAHAHAFEVFLHSPRLNLCSPEKGCGKTLVLDVLAALVPRPLRTESITPAVLFRLVELHRPVLLLDEIDTYLHEADELRGLLNAGHKRGAKAFRCEGEKNEVRAFAAFAPAALAGIGSLPGTLHDRSIVVELTRAKPGEVTARFDSRYTLRESELCRKLARWVVDNLAPLKNLDPALPGSAFNRVADKWRPLFAIAETAGGDWPARAAASFVALTTGDELDAHGTGTALLADIHSIFIATQADRLASARIAEMLAAMEGKRWPEFGKGGKPISANQVARLLTRFKIHSRTIRISDTTAKGYCLADFQDAFARFLPATAASKGNTVTTPENIGDTPLFETSQADSLLPFENAVSANKDASCDSVTDQNIGTPEKPAEALLL